MKKIIILSGIIFLAFAIIALPFFVTPSLIKVQIKCKSQFGPCPGEVSSRVGEYNGKSLYTSKLNIRRLLSADAGISDYGLQFKLPNVLEIYVVVKKPFAALTLRNQNKAALIDTDGKILSFDETTTLPKVFVGQINQKEGEKISDKEFFAVKIVTGVFEMYQVESGEIVEDSLVVELLPQIRVIFPLYGDTDVLLGSLRLIYSKINEPDQLKKFSEIDLRFKNAVLR